MEEIRMFIVDSWKGPKRQDGAAKWLVECMRHGEPRTREGMVCMEKGTQAQAVLAAASEAMGILNRPCRVRIYTECAHVSNAVQNGWHLQWRENGWRNAKGKPVKNAVEWKEFLKSAEPHEYTAGSGWHEHMSAMQGDVARELVELKKKKKAEAGTQMTLEGLM